MSKVFLFFGSYDTCVHSHKKKNASWKVYNSCQNPNRLFTGKGYELPYKAICMECPFYKNDSRTNPNT